MSVYFIVNVTIKNPADRSLYDKYIEAVKPIVESYGGRYIVRSELVTPVSGGWKPDRIIVIEFPAKERLDACFRSEEYRSIKVLRESSVAAEAIIVEQSTTTNVGEEILDERRIHSYE
jgi:uncharacterized protein (DUF1330 family)